MDRFRQTVAILSISATAQAVVIYSVDRSLLIAAAWALAFLLFISVEFLLLPTAVAPFVIRLNRSLELGRFRHVPSLVIAMGFWCGMLFGPIFGVGLSQLLSVHVTGVRAAWMGIVVGIPAFSVVGLICGVIISARQSQSPP
jgi:hypothetical protein